MGVSVAVPKSQPIDAGHPPTTSPSYVAATSHPAEETAQAGWGATQTGNLVPGEEGPAVEFAAQ